MKYILLVFVALFLSTGASAQKDIKTDSFLVDGNCSMCKKRIEDAAYIRGVKRADWNVETHQLSVVYRTSKTDLETIAHSVARAGHSSEKSPADEESYGKLPNCCQYKTESCEH